jgi:hypothetical protein
VLYCSGEDIGNCLDPTVRMPGKAREVIIRDVAAEIIQQKEGIQLRCIAEPECPVQAHARALNGRRGFSQTLNRSKSHTNLL